MVPGHPYSVAEHSWLLAEACLHYYPDVLKEDRESFRRLQLRCLLHDGSEAYLGDMPGPVKGHPLLEGYRVLEAKMQAAIYRRFGLEPECDEGHDHRVHLLDRTILFEELGFLWKRFPDEVAEEFDLVAFANRHGELDRLVEKGQPRFAFGVRGLPEVDSFELFNLAHFQLQTGIFHGFGQKRGVVG